MSDNYKPTNWNTGDKITKEKLNNIENGIVNIDKNKISTETYNLDKENLVTKEEIEILKNNYLSLEIYDNDKDGSVGLANNIKGVDIALNNTYYGKDSTGEVGFHQFPTQNIDIINIKGSVENNTALESIEQKEIGDVYVTKDNGHLYIYDGEYWVDMGEFRGPQGPAGAKGEATTITIGENGNWFLDGVDSGHKSQGEQGIQGPKGESGFDAIDDNGEVSTDKIWSSQKVSTEFIKKVDTETYNSDKETFALKIDLTNKANVSDVYNKSETYTRLEVEGLIEDIDISNQLTNLATKEELNLKLDTSDYNSEKENFATTTQLEDKLDSSVYEEEKVNFANKSELGNKQDKTDNSLQTTDKTVVGAINDLFKKIESVLKPPFRTINNSNIAFGAFPYEAGEELTILHEMRFISEILLINKNIFNVDEVKVLLGANILPTTYIIEEHPYKDTGLHPIKITFKEKFVNTNKRPLLLEYVLKYKESDNFEIVNFILLDRTT